VHLGREISTHYFSFLGGPEVVSLKSTPGHVTPNLCVLHPVGSASHVVHSRGSGAQNLNALFSCRGGTSCGLHKKRVATRYAEHVFFHPVGSAGPIVDSNAFGERNLDAHFSCSCGTSTYFIKSTLGHVTMNLCFCIRCDFWVT
jgi:hypothetical protein